MKILLLNAFHGGSHADWANDLVKHSKHEVILWTLRGKYWKWRMHGAAVSFAERYNKEEPEIDLILCTDMLDLAVFRGLINSPLPPTAIYFHENQIMYPWQEGSDDVGHGRDMHYGFINYTSCLAADAIFFNSNFHKNGFLSSLTPFLKAYPDERNLDTIKSIEQKAEVLYLGLDLNALDQHKKDKNETPTFLWNHRHEHDKNPDDFFNVLIGLSKEGAEFQLIVVGEEYVNEPEVFAVARQQLASHILHWGYAKSKAEYAELLWRSTHLPVTSKHDFFGVSVIEAVHCRVIPILPNRLVYPEHFHEKGLFYGSMQEFRQILENVVRRDSVQPSTNLVVGHYDWDEQIPNYDRAFADLARK